MICTFHNFDVLLQDAVKKCEQNVEDHKEYKEKFGKAEICIRGIKEKYAKCSTLTNTKDDLEAKQTIIQVCLLTHTYVTKRDILLF